MGVFTRKGYIAIAKALRDEQGMSRQCRMLAVRAVVKVFRADDHSFREDIFRAIANAELEDDPVTRYVKIGEF